MSEFTPEQIQEILDIFFDNFAHRQYIGQRYVPIFGRKGEDSIEWDNTGTYEPLTIVLYEGNSYTSRQFVPVGVAITNQAYWANTGNYNAQVEAYRQEVVTLAAMLPDTDFNAVNTVKKYVDDIATGLASDISDEETARIYQDSLRVVGFANVAAMKASEDIKTGMVCHTDGFHTSGDGGAAYYEIRATGTANEMDVIACGELYAHLVIENEITPEMLGAYGNGVNNDSDSFIKAVTLGVPVVCNNEYNAYGIEIENDTDILFGEKSRIIPHYKDEYKNVFDNVFYIHDAVVNINGLNFIGSDDAVGGNSVQSYYTEPIFNIGQNVILKVTNSLFKHLYMGNRAETPAQFTQRNGIVITCITPENITFDSCSFENFNREEWGMCFASTGKGLLKINNCNIIQDGTSNNYGYSTFGVFGMFEIIFTNNYIYKFVYTGSFINAMGISSYFSNNLFVNCKVGDVFDCSNEGSELGIGTIQENTICVNNVTENTIAGKFITAISNNLVVKNNNVTTARLATLSNRDTVTYGNVKSEMNFICENNTMISNENATSDDINGTATNAAWAIVSGLVFEDDVAFDDCALNMIVKNNYIYSPSKFSIQTIYGRSAKFINCCNNIIFGNGRTASSSAITSLFEFLNGKADCKAIINNNELTEFNTFSQSKLCVMTLKENTDNFGFVEACNNILNTLGTFIDFLTTPSVTPSKNNNYNVDLSA